MPRSVAFLRAINVGGHNVAMSVLKREFERLGCKNVETFIASGNVIFTAASQSIGSLERSIEEVLHGALGYDVATFVRTDAEVAAVARYRPFPESDVARAAALNIGFVSEPLSPAGRRALQALATGIDSFHVHGREIYWLCRKKQSGSTFSNAVLERTLGIRSTLRNVKTIVRLAAILEAPAARGAGKQPREPPRRRRDR
jgi:uncharacterized protein (DUF1697 family)